MVFVDNNAHDTNTRLIFLEETISILAFIANSAYEVIALAQKPNGTPLEHILECV